MCNRAMLKTNFFYVVVSKYCVRVNWELRLAHLTTFHTKNIFSNFAIFSQFLIPPTQDDYIKVLLKSDTILGPENVNQTAKISATNLLKNW